MNSLDAITLKAFLVALTQLEDSLSAELQGELNALGKEFPSGVSNLHVLAKGLAPLEQAYKKARGILQADPGERLNCAGSDVEDAAQSYQEDLRNFITVLNASDSVASAKEIAQESVPIQQLLVQLQKEMSITVSNPASIPDNSEFEAAMEAFAITRKNYRNAFRELAK
ncbi:hypothetical protein [Moorena sp. SIO1G6]|uniref:hypothetical protein n=1 Tax=Moorena sp. SIO1G6 TaxID=2607840 RepID=UPI00258019C0|nr:hypothetical protein [Moorena sp. SIO1G6]